MKTPYLRPETLLCKHLGDTLPEGVGVAWLGLDSNLDGLHWSQGNVSKELGAGGGRQVQRCPPEVGVLLSQHTTGHSHAQTQHSSTTSALPPRRSDTPAHLPSSF